MTITIKYLDGTTEQFTSATDPVIENGVVTFTGTDSAGVTGSWSLNWSAIRSISVQQ